MSNQKKFSLTSFKEKVLKDVKLPCLFMVAAFLQVACFLTIAIIFVVFGYLQAEAFNTSKNIKVVITGVATEKSLQLVMCVFCAMMVVYPAIWLSYLAKMPSTFFLTDESQPEVYQPLPWLCFWTSVLMIIFSGTISLRLWVYILFAVSFSVAIMCILLIEYYRRLMRVQK